MAVIDKSFYRGTDAYSDGDEAENTILGLVREGKDFRELEQVDWPTLYHLSPIRENICNWYPFQTGSRVLEIGAGCGAVTGALCGKGLEVYSVDLSLRRSTINYERHKDCEDLHLVVGNLNDVSFPEPFDYILLIGVLEYAGRFTEGGHPYRSFLENIRRLLKPDGKLLLAIENRFGLKYFAGAPEDHLGEAFVGLRGYDPQVGIRTFSKSELTNLLEQSGFRGHRFYYPYPDYKFPLEIFTEETLVSQHYGKPFQVFDRDRLEIFPEAKVAGILTEDGAAGALANSFLVEASLEAAALDPEHVFYAKLNSGRNEPFRIGTRIVGTDAPGCVAKYALADAAVPHIQRIAKNENRLAERRNVLKGERRGPEVVYPFCRGKTLEDILREAAAREDAAGVVDVFERLRELSLIDAAEAEEAPAFAQWFGEEKLSAPAAVYTAPADVDMVPDNVFVEGDELILTDCEWVTDFPVPVGFILWRSVENAWSRIPELEAVIGKEELHRRLGIRAEDIPVYHAWSWHFENTFVADGSNARFARAIRQAAYSPAQAEKMEQELKSQAEHIEQLMQSERELQGEVGSQAEHIEQLMQSERELQGEVGSQAEHIEQLMQSERELQGEVGSQAEHIQQLMQSERELRGTVDSQEAHIKQLMQSERELQGTVGSQEAHIGQLMQSERELRGTVGSQEAHIEKLLQSERELRGTVGSQEAHIEQLLQSERDLKGAVENRDAHIEQLLQSERDLKGMVESRDAELQSVYSSYSWRMTSVFRKIHDRLTGRNK